MSISDDEEGDEGAGFATNGDPRFEAPRKGEPLPPSPADDDDRVQAQSASSSPSSGSSSQQHSVVLAQAHIGTSGSQEPVCPTPGGQSGEISNHNEANPEPVCPAPGGESRGILASPSLSLPSDADAHKSVDLAQAYDAGERNPEPVCPTPGGESGEISHSTLISRKRHSGASRRRPSARTSRQSQTPTTRSRTRSWPDLRPEAGPPLEEDGRAPSATPCYPLEQISGRIALTNVKQIVPTTGSRRAGRAARATRTPRISATSPQPRRPAPRQHEGQRRPRSAPHQTAPTVRGSVRTLAPTWAMTRWQSPARNAHGADSP